ncbi:hypothetical protein [Metaclostridioides mangenotii]|uniref:hypothetical protein n=1 Tax=Metaclostridioides mangenotii TaxID=1540 RepID=UPI000464A85E|nr:hypothetical protein [Clostridioides mangenotii]
MYFERKDSDFLNSEGGLEYLVNGSRSFADGIYIPCDYHPCGWDFISFENIVLDKEDEFYEDNNPLTYIIMAEDISKGVYDDYHPYVGLTLKRLLEKIDYKFEIEGN